MKVDLDSLVNGLSGSLSGKMGYDNVLGVKNDFP